MRAKLGVGLLLVAGILVFAVAGNFTLTANVAIAAAVLGLAAGALLSGTADEEGRPV